MLYPREALERAMKIQEVILRELSGEITWVQAAEILGCNPRSLRRWLRRYERWGYDGLLDRRRGRPSPRRVPLAEVQRILRLYRERYAEFSARHFWHFATRQHGVRLSYGWVKAALQTAGLVAKGRRRGRHRRRREPRPCVGELLHLDGSRHQWLALDPGRYVKVAGIATLPATNRYLRERFIPLYDELFSRPPTTLPRPSSLSAASTSPRSCVTKRSASSPATTPSASTASCCSSPSSRGGPPARASASWSASI
jgi:transposase